jgi:hypothetical protein
MMTKRMILLAMLACMATGCTHVEWFGGNAERGPDEPSMVKIVEVRF